jgi:adenine-specific DNA-methyltransferase
MGITWTRSRALLPYYAGQVKCIYIDPPYNTKSAFEHYDDNLEHSQWLAMIWPRLELLRELLHREGVIFVHIDDGEEAYLKVACDEIFGRKNYCGKIVWEKKKKPSFLNANMGTITEYILCYARDRSMSPPFTYGETTVGKKYPINNAGNSPSILTFPEGAVEFGVRDAHFVSQDMSEGNIVTELLDHFSVVDGRNAEPFRLRGEWRYSQARLNEIVSAGERITISKAPFRPNHVKAGGEAKKMKNLLSIAHYGMATYEDSSAESLALFGDDPFDYPKPEKLLEVIIAAVTLDGDLVLDSFLGSGTTSAVAHKMGRRYIGIEMGDHAVTHCAPRLKKVIEGEQGGISKTAGWQGGGGFTFYRLGNEVFDADGRICAGIAFGTLAAHVWFSETGVPLIDPAISPFLGINGERGYALLYNGVLGDKRPHGGNVLTNATLALIREGSGGFGGPLTIYGESSRLSEARLRAEGITFKQTPYDVKAR